MIFFEGLINLLKKQPKLEPIKYEFNIFKNDFLLPFFNSQCLFVFTFKIKFLIIIIVKKEILN